MKQLSEDDEEAYNRQFKRYVDAGITGDSLEAIYTKAHAAIRKEPTKARGPLELGYFGVRAKAVAKDVKHPTKRYNKAKLSLKQRRARVQQILTHRGIKPIAKKDA